jgi:hypothetical protein
LAILALIAAVGVLGARADGDLASANAARRRWQVRQLGTYRLPECHSLTARQGRCCGVNRVQLRLGQLQGHGTRACVSLS